MRDQYGFTPQDYQPATYNLDVDAEEAYIARYMKALKKKQRNESIHKTEEKTNVQAVQDN